MVVAFCSACELYFSQPHGTSDAHAPADAARADAPTNACGQSIADEPACSAQLDCGPDHHCEVQCAPAGTDGCVYRCHSTCVQNECCARVDCGSASACVESCLRDCQAMAQYCSESCVAKANLGCSAILDEATCLATAACIPVYHGANCTCQNEVCDCQDTMGPFARCESAMP